MHVCAEQDNEGFEDGEESDEDNPMVPLVLGVRAWSARCVWLVQFFPQVTVDPVNTISRYLISHQRE